MLISLHNNGLRVIIDENNFEPEDLELIKHLERKFIIKNFVRVNGHI